MQWLHKNKNKCNDCTGLNVHAVGVLAVTCGLGMEKRWLAEA
jgi:hypothetical protein